jgi:hypothetical protein
MHLSHLLSDHIQQRQTALLLEAEQARLARLARPETATFQQRLLALQRSLRTRLFGHKVSSRKHTARLATGCCLSPVLPGVQCCVSTL